MECRESGECFVVSLVDAWGGMRYDEGGHEVCRKWVANAEWRLFQIEAMVG